MSRSEPVSPSRAWLAAIALGLLASACGNESGDSAVSTDANLGNDAVVGEAIGMNQAGEKAPVAPMTPGRFVSAVAASDQFEIDSAKLAATHAGSAEIKLLAERLRTDHENSAIELRAAAAQAAPPVTVTPTLDRPQQDMFELLKTANGADFDRRFIDQQTNAHQKALGLLQDYLANGNSQPLKDFASRARTVVQDHLENLNGIRK